MSPIAVLLIIGTIAAVVFLGFLVVGYFQSHRGDTSKELREERDRSIIAQNALREISAGAELPIFVASDALDKIHNTYIKELH